MEKDFKINQSIMKQTEILFQNFLTTVNGIDDDLIHDGIDSGWSVSDHLYHALRSMDQWFINPNAYEERFKAVKRGEAEKHSKKELLSYFENIKSKLCDYIEKLKDNDLHEKPDHCEFTRLELMLGQFRHFMYHIGFVHALIRLKTGETPEYIGLGGPVKPVGKR
jgi:uncharacterized damage-inducible protein DinB